jgi:hypothetical protein
VSVLDATLAAAAPPAEGRRWDRRALLLLAAATLLVLFTFRDYGVTWDEDVHNWYGNFVLDYYLSFFADRRALDWLNLYNYGAAFDMVAALANRVSALGTYETRHLLNGLVGILGILGCARLGRTLGGPRAGFLAALLLLLTPNYYGSMFNNPKDIPFAAAGVWALYYLVRLVPLLPRPPLSLAVRLGLAIGLALGVRVGGLLFLCYLGLLLCLDTVWRAAAAKRPGSLPALGWTSLWRVLAPVTLVAYPVMLLFWPWAQQAPIGHPLRALLFFSHETFPYPTLFDGRMVPASDLPPAYLPTHIVLALPELVLCLLAASPVLAAAILWRRRAGIAREIALPHFLLGFAILFPVAYAVAIKAVLFDGMRHFIFVLPPIAVAAALAADRAIEALRRFSWRAAVYGAVGVYGLAHLALMVALHPDEYVYYNALVGGVAGAQGRFKLDYWANSYAEAVRGLATYLKGEYGEGFAGRQFTVAVCGPPISADYYFPANFHLTQQRDQADFFIAFTKDDCDRSLPGEPVYEVRRLGARLSVVLDRRAHLGSRQAVTGGEK